MAGSSDFQASKARYFNEENNPKKIRVTGQVEMPSRPAGMPS
jgi:hypothetical protein